MWQHTIRKRTVLWVDVIIYPRPDKKNYLKINVKKARIQYKKRRFLKMRSLRFLHNYTQHQHRNACGDSEADAGEDRVPIYGERYACQQPEGVHGKKRRQALKRREKNAFEKCTLFEHCDYRYQQNDAHACNQGVFHIKSPFEPISPQSLSSFAFFIRKLYCVSSSFIL